MSSARAFMKTLKRMWSLVTFKLQARIHFCESKNIHLGFPDEVNKNRIIDGIGLVHHMTLVKKQGHVSIELLPFYANPNNLVSINRLQFKT